MDSKVIALLEGPCTTLTAEEIVKLDLPTLRLVVAKHVGFSFKPGEDCYMKVTSPGGLENKHGNDVFWEIPDYCYSMTQAWELVKELRKEDIFIGCWPAPSGYDANPCHKKDRIYQAWHPWPGPAGKLQSVFMDEEAPVVLCRWYIWIKQNRRTV